MNLFIIFCCTTTSLILLSFFIEKTTKEKKKEVGISNSILMKLDQLVFCVIEHNATGK
jgi:hypothetical protein